MKLGFTTGLLCMLLGILSGCQKQNAEENESKQTADEQRQTVSVQLVTPGSKEARFELIVSLPKKADAGSVVTSLSGAIYKALASCEKEPATSLARSGELSLALQMNGKNITQAAGGGTPTGACLSTQLRANPLPTAVPTALDAKLLLRPIAKATIAG